MYRSESVCKCDVWNLSYLMVELKPPPPRAELLLLHNIQPQSEQDFCYVIGYVTTLCAFNSPI